MTLLSLYFALSLTFRIQAEDKRQPSIDNIMPGFQLYASNRQEELINYLACHVLAVPLKDPLATELIVVQHQGIQRWVSLEITHKLVILANTRFLFPNELTQIVFEAIVPDNDDLLDNCYNQIVQEIRILLERHADHTRSSLNELKKFSDPKTFLESENEFDEEEFDNDSSFTL